MPDILPSIDETLSSRNIIATPMRIGFLGLGMIGCGMVDNLLRSGHEVTVWNRTTSKVDYCFILIVLLLNCNLDEDVHPHC